MISPCTLKINKLRKKNRALLDQLESNSALLERRLKKLKHTAKTEKHSDKSWENLPPSPLKRKFESWKARNYSGQVSAALHRDTCDCTQSCSDTVDAETQLKQTTEESPVISPPKRTRHNVHLSSNRRKKSSPKSPREPRSPLKSSTSLNTTRKPIKCSKCHCRISMHDNETSLNEDESTNSSLTCVCNCRIESPKRCLYKEEEENVYRDKKILEVAKPVLNYSPKSAFLRRIKKRSQTLGNLLSPGNIRKSQKVLPTCSKSTETIPNKIETKPKISPKKSSPVEFTYFDETSVGDGKVTAGSSRDSCRSPTARSLRDLHEKTRVKLPHRNIYSRPTTTKSEIKDFYSMSPPRDHSSRPLTEKSPLYSENLPTKMTRSTRKPRKRVCYRKNCYCRVQQKKPKAKKVIIEDVKENLIDEDPLDVSSSEEQTSSDGSHCCCCCCDRKQRTPPSRAPLMADTISDLVKNEIENKHIDGKCCSCDKGSRWFSKLNEFRHTNYFDCYAQPSRLCVDSRKNWESTSGESLTHKCVHKYTVDDRLFARPLYTDHKNNSRCTTCHLPLEVSKAGKDGLIPITLPSNLDNTNIQVSVPLEKNKHTSSRTPKKLSHSVTRGKTNSSKVKSRLTSHTVSDFKAWMPPPADSLALRYQKGVIK